LDLVPPEHQSHQQSLFLAANKATTHGIVAYPCGTTPIWLIWLSYLHQNYPSVCPYLQNLSRCQINVLLGAYAMYIRHGKYKLKPRRVGCETVKVARLRAIGAQCALEREPNPMVRPQGRYHLPIARILNSFKREDPAPRSQPALPVSALTLILARGQSASSQKVKALADSCIIAWWFYLLRVGEYTYKPSLANTCTTPFTIGDITLWNNNTP
jgi:hypothetical protein